MCAQVLSLSIDFYVRIFVRVYTSPEVVKESATKQMYLWQSSGCDSFYTQRIARKVWHTTIGWMMFPPQLSNSVHIVRTRRCIATEWTDSMRHPSSLTQRMSPLA